MGPKRGIGQTENESKKKKKFSKKIDEDEISPTDETVEMIGENLTVAELKTRLTIYGKKVSGKKSDLIKRLQQAMQSSSAPDPVPLDKPPYESITIGSITFVSFDWETFSHSGNIWQGKSNFEFQNQRIYFWEISIHDLEKAYQYEYTDLGIITSSNEKFFVSGLIGEMTHQWNGQLRGIDSENNEVRGTNTSLDVPHYRIRLKDGDSVGFLLNLLNDEERTLTIIPRQNYSCDPTKPHTQPALVFSSKLLKLWSSSTVSFGTLSVAGRIPTKIPLFAYATVGQLGKRFEKKFLPNTSRYITVQRWKTREEEGKETEGEEKQDDERRVPPVEALEYLLFTHPMTTLNPTTLSSSPYDADLLERIERSERFSQRMTSGVQERGRHRSEEGGEP
jgi:hypothetical protein